jgi:hypothetical protein
MCRWEPEPAGSGTRGYDQRPAADDRRWGRLLLLAAAVIVTRGAPSEGLSRDRPGAAARRSAVAGVPLEGSSGLRLLVAYNLLFTMLGRSFDYPAGPAATPSGIAGRSTRPM